MSFHMSLQTGQAFPVERLRTEFPALQRAGSGIFFDRSEEHTSELQSPI